MQDREDRLKDLETQLSVIEKNVDKWVDKVGGNEWKLKALHSRMDTFEKKLNAVMTKEDLSEELDAQFNKHVVRALKVVLGSALTAITATLGAWGIHIFGLGK